MTHHHIPDYSIQVYTVVFFGFVFFSHSPFSDRPMKAAIAQVQAMAKSYPKYSFYTCDIDDAPLAAYDAEVGTTTSRCVLKRVETPIFMALVVPKVLINHGIFFFAFRLTGTIFSDEPQEQCSIEPTHIYIYVYIYVYIYMCTYYTYIQYIHIYIHV